MMAVDIGQALNSLWASNIKECSLDLANFSLQLNLEHLNCGITKKHQLLITGIDMLCFSDERSPDGRSLPMFMELTGIDLCRGKNLVSIAYGNESSSEKRQSTPNLVLEISDAVLLISAKQIQIDDISFSL